MRPVHSVKSCIRARPGQEAILTQTTALVCSPSHDSGCHIPILSPVRLLSDADVVECGSPAGGGRNKRRLRNPEALAQPFGPFADREFAGEDVGYPRSDAKDLGEVNRLQVVGFNELGQDLHGIRRSVAQRGPDGLLLCHNRFNRAFANRARTSCLGWPDFCFWRAKRFNRAFANRARTSRRDAVVRGEPLRVSIAPSRIGPAHQLCHQRLTLSTKVSTFPIA